MAGNASRENGKLGGRPQGARNKLQISDYLTEEEIRQIVNTAKEKAFEGDPSTLKLLIEQAFGKAPQSMDMTTDGDKITFTINEGSTDKSVEPTREPKETDTGSGEK